LRARISERKSCIVSARPSGFELISSLFNQRHMYEAQLAAINYFERDPDGEFADYVTRETRIPPPPRRGKP
jgi:hypothetical protein